MVVHESRVHLFIGSSDTRRIQMFILRIKVICAKYSLIFAPFTPSKCIPKTRRSLSVKLLKWRYVSYRLTLDTKDP